jgi:hypothetical protein
MIIMGEQPQFKLANHPKKTTCRRVYFRCKKFE